jgi:FtsZ-interacting cell division protein ZipA
MDVLRWILLIFGAILIGGIYFAGRRKHPDAVQRREPGLDAEGHERDEDEGEQADDFEVEADDPEDSFDFERLLADERDSTPPAPARTQAKDSHHSMLLEDEFVVLHLTVPSVTSLSGSRLYSALHELGFDLEEDEIFHYRESDCPLIVVNMFKPGTFPPDPDDFTSKGVSFILRLSRTEHPLDSFDEMVVLAYELKSLLNLQLFDMQRSSLTKQTIAYLEEEIGEYQRRRGL